MHLELFRQLVSWISTMTTDETASGTRYGWFSECALIEEDIRHVLGGQQSTRTDNRPSQHSRRHGDGSEANTANIQLASVVCDELEASPTGFVVVTVVFVEFPGRTASEVVPSLGLGEVTVVRSLGEEAPLLGRGDRTNLERSTATSAQP